MAGSRRYLMHPSKIFFVDEDDNLQRTELIGNVPPIARTPRFDLRKILFVFSVHGEFLSRVLWLAVHLFRLFPPFFHKDSNFRDSFLNAISITQLVD